MWKDILTHPFAWGLGLGLLLFVMSFWAHFKTKREFSRYRKHLSDRLELDSKFIEDVKKDRERLSKENENLRIVNSKLSEKGDHRVLRDLEVYARAEKSMNMQAPGFAAVWEAVKSKAMEEVRSEEEGKSLPQRIYRKIFGGGKDVVEAQSTRLLDAPPASAVITPAPADAPPTHATASVPVPAPAKSADVPVSESEASEKSSS